MNLERDKALVSNVLSGDMASFEALVEAYQQPLSSFVYKLTFSREDTEEIIQEVFIKAFNRLRTYDARWSFSSWVYTIALNTFRKEYRRRLKRRASEVPPEALEHLGNPEGCPEEIAVTRERYRQVVELVNSLSEEQKTAFLLKHAQGFSFKEIGKVMGISPEAAKMKVHRAKLSLGEKLDGLRKRGVLDDVQIR